MTDTERARERRQLTIAFCDLIDATALSNVLDPEDYGDIVETFRGVCERVVKELEGHVAQYLGDGILLYFGYPNAQEDAAVRAVRVALRIVEEVAIINATCRLPDGFKLGVRLGVHTGTVVTAHEGLTGRGAELALGSAPNIAARLQAIAAPNSVLISEATFRLAAGFFDFEALGERALKGVPETVAVYQVLGGRRVSSRFEVSLHTGLSPFLGRDEILTELADVWAGVVSGRPHGVALRGEPGVGKSRLVHELRRRIEPKGRWLQVSCSEHGRNRAFHCLGESLECLAGIIDGDDARTSLAKLESTLDSHDLGSPESVRLCAGLLDLKLPPDRDVPLGLRPQEIRARTSTLLLQLFQRLARKGPLALCFEDLHWVDPSSEELIVRLMQGAEQYPLLCLCTFRPSYSPAWEAGATEISLTPLSTDHIRALARHLLDQSASERVIERIASHSDGIPLFAEELARTALDAANEEGPSSSHVPATLQDSLMARLDQLPEGKPVAQLVSVYGRRVTDVLLRSTGALEDHLVERGVEQLLGAGILYRDAPGRLAFKHALVQDAAYASLVRRSRQQYHRMVAAALGQQAQATGKNERQALAHHFFHAGNLDKAAELWIVVAQQAADAGASREAEAQLAHARDALEQLTDVDQRNEFELSVQMVRGQLAMAGEGYASQAVEQAFSRALELCRVLGRLPAAGGVTKLLASRVLCSDDLAKAKPIPDPLFWVLWGFGAFHQARAEHGRALQIGERLLRMAAGRPELLVEGHFGAGSSLYYLGNFRAAADHLAKGAETCKTSTLNAAALMGHRADFLCLGYLSLCLWHLGDTEGALAENARAFELAEGSNQPYVMASGYAMQASLLQLMRDAEGALAAGDAALALADKYGFGFVAMWVKPILGWAMMQTAGSASGLQMLEDTLTSEGAATTRVFQTYTLGLKAECLLQTGSLNEACKCVDKALALAEETGERFWEPELFRLRGAIELRQLGGRASLAQAMFRRALRQAREQRAVSTERRVMQQLSTLVGHGREHDRASFERVT